MDKLDVGDAVIVRGVVTHEGIRVGNAVLPAGEVTVLSDLPKFVGIQNALPLLFFFATEEDRADFARAYTGLPDLESRTVDLD